MESCQIATQAGPLNLVSTTRSQAGPKGVVVCASLVCAGRTVQTVREDLQHLMDKYSSSPALLRIRGLPVYYVYDSYRIPADAWAKVLSPTGDITVRDTTLDGMH